MQVAPYGGQIFNLCKWRHFAAKFSTLLMAPFGSQICNLCKWSHLVAKFATRANDAIWWPNFKLMQCHVVAEFSHGVNFWVRCASGNVFLTGGNPPLIGGASVTVVIFYLLLPYWHKPLINPNWFSIVWNCKQYQGRNWICQFKHSKLTTKWNK